VKETGKERGWKDQGEGLAKYGSGTKKTGKRLGKHPGPETGGDNGKGR